MAENKYLSTKRVSDTWQPVLSGTAPLSLVSTGSTKEEENEMSPWEIEAISEVSWSYALFSFIYGYPFERLLFHK
jgi:hypothetical protein